MSDDNDDVTCPSCGLTFYCRELERALDQRDQAELGWKQSHAAHAETLKRLDRSAASTRLAPKGTK